MLTNEEVVALARRFDDQSAAGDEAEHLSPLLDDAQTTGEQVVRCFLQKSAKFWDNQLALTSPARLAVLVRLTQHKQLKSPVFAFVVLRDIPFPHGSLDSSLLLQLLVNLSANSEIRERVFGWSVDRKLAEVIKPHLLLANEEHLQLTSNFAACNSHSIKQQVLEDLDLGSGVLCGSTAGVRLALNLSNDTALAEQLLNRLDVPRMLEVDEPTALLVLANLALQPSLKPVLFQHATRHLRQSRSNSTTPLPPNATWNMLNNIVAGDLALKRQLWQEVQQEVLPLMMTADDRGALALMASLAGEPVNAQEMASSSTSKPDLLEYALKRNLNMLWNLASVEASTTVLVFAWLERTSGAFAVLLEAAKQVANAVDRKAAYEIIRIFSNHGELQARMLDQFKRDEVFHEVIKYATMMGKDKI